MPENAIYFMPCYAIKMFALAGDVTRQLAYVHVKSANVAEINEKLYAALAEDNT